MGLALNNILGKACSHNKDFSREDISITWINYKSENKSVFKGFGSVSYTHLRAHETQ